MSSASDHIQNDIIKQFIDSSQEFIKNDYWEVFHNLHCNRTFLNHRVCSCTWIMSKKNYQLMQEIDKQFRDITEKEKTKFSNIVVKLKAAEKIPQNVLNSIERINRYYRNNLENLFENNKHKGLLRTSPPFRDSSLHFSKSTWDGPSPHWHWEFDEELNSTICRKYYNEVKDDISVIAEFTNSEDKKPVILGICICSL